MQDFRANHVSYLMLSIFTYMNKILFLLLFTAIGLPVVFAQSTIIPLYPDGVPDCRVDSVYRVEIDKNIGRKMLSVQEPELEVFFPPAYRANGQAVLIFPGGGYYLQAYDWEGTEFAKWLNRRGIAAYVLKYRLPHWSGEGCRDHVALDDAKRAMEIIRTEAMQEGSVVDPSQIGIMGFSAGGHLASSLGTHFEDEAREISVRPDFMVLVYPVISSDTAISHAGSFRNLLGEHPDADLLRYYASELQVTEQTPPTFLVHAADDEVVPAANSIRFFEALLAQSVAAELHIYPTGGHGFALAEEEEILCGWLNLLADWLQSQEQ